MNLENLKNTLSAQNIGIEEFQIVKNGIECQGIRIIDPANTSISPVVYYSETETLEEITEKILDAVNSGVTGLDTSLFSDPEFILGNAFIAARRKSSDNSVKRACMNLDACVRVLVPVDSDWKYGSFAMTGSLLAQVGIPEDDLWDAAIQNTRASIMIQSMELMLGFPESYDPSLFVVTAESTREGAGALAVKDIFRGFCKGKNEQGCYIIPSSTEDLILVPFSKAGDLDPNCLSHMTESVNEECVDPILQLDPVCYRYTLLTDELEIAAAVRG